MTCCPKTGCNVLSFSLAHMTWLPPACRAISWAFRIINKWVDEPHHLCAEWFATHFKTCVPINRYLFSQQSSNGSCYNYQISRDRIRKLGIGQHRMGPWGRMPLAWNPGLDTPSQHLWCDLSIIEARSLTWSRYLMSFGELHQSVVKFRAPCLQVTAQIHPGPQARARKKAKPTQREPENGCHTKYQTMRPSCSIFHGWAPGFHPFAPGFHESRGEFLGALGGSVT